MLIWDSDVFMDSANREVSLDLIVRLQYQPWSSRID